MAWPEARTLSGQQLLQVAQAGMFRHEVIVRQERMKMVPVRREGFAAQP
jgi:hypothetical protein